MANPGTDTMNKVNGAEQDFKNKISGAEKGLEKMVQNVGKNIGERAMDIENAAETYLKTGREYVQDHPAKSVAIAAAAGLVAGGLISMMMNNRK